MKFSNNSIAMLIFITLAITVFVLMAMRPAIETNAMNFGMPIKVDTDTKAANKIDDPEIKVEEIMEPAKTEEMDSQNTSPETPTVEAPTSDSISTEVPEVEPIPVESMVPSSSETSTN